MAGEAVGGGLAGGWGGSNQERQDKIVGQGAIRRSAGAADTGEAPGAGRAIETQPRCRPRLSRASSVWRGSDCS